MREIIKKITLYTLIPSFMVALLVTAFLMWPQIDHNSMQEYCTSIAHESRILPENIDRVYIKEESGYIKFDPEKHHAYKIFYIKTIDTSYNLSEANARSQGRLCKLTEAFWRELSALFIGLFFITYISLFSLFMCALLFFFSAKAIKTKLKNKE